MHACTDIYRHIYRRIYTSTPLNRFALQLKLTEDSKSTIPQVLKKKNERVGGTHTKPSQSLVTLLPIGRQTFADILNNQDTGRTIVHHIRHSERIHQRLYREVTSEIYE